MAKEKILVVDDEKLVRWSLKEGLEKEGYIVSTAETGEKALKMFSEDTIHLILLDNNLPGIDGVEMLKRVREIDADIPVIMITAYADIKGAIKATKLGAFDYLSKPFEKDEISIVVKKALETTRLKREVAHLLDEQEKKYGFSQIIAKSRVMQEAIKMAKEIAETETTTILLQGETGTGKDLLARAIHHASPRAKEPFVSIPCPNIPGNLLESELFGYEKGAFTDAKKQKKGLLETSSGGTVYLDEIGDVELGVQTKLLRYLEEKTFRRLGGLKEIFSDSRIIVSTNKDLIKMVKDGTFREDLYYRLKIFHLYLPPLRKRKDDILLLCLYFIDLFNREYHKEITGIVRETERLLLSYDWPGNVRELRNVIERGVMLQKKGELLPGFLPPEIQGMQTSESKRLDGISIPESGVSLEQIEKEIINKALRLSNGNQTRAARLLGISRDTLRYRLKKYKIKSTG